MRLGPGMARAGVNVQPEVTFNHLGATRPRQRFGRAVTGPWAVVAHEGDYGRAPSQALIRITPHRRYRRPARQVISCWKSSEN